MFFFVFKRTFNYRYMFYRMNRNIVFTCAHCMDCVHSVVWYVEDESYVVASYKADTILSTTSYLLQTNM